jgi:methyl-accepting chemotaxis protein
MNEKNLSIQTKFLVAFTLGFLTILGASTLLTMDKEKQLIDHLVEDMLHNTARSYFDGINTMMLTGTMAQRDVLRDKVLKQPNILDARIIRNQALDPLLKATEARDHELPKDDLDRRALAGEEISLTASNADGRTLSVLVPLKAVSDYSGTNCLTCHQVPEGSVLGAVRVDMSLAYTDAEIHAGLLGNLLVNALLFVVGLALFAWLFRHLVSRRMQRLEQSMAHITEQADLCTRIEVVANDEIGRVSKAFNHMVERFHSSLRDVSKTSHQLNQSADEITQVVEQTANAVLEQQNETDSVATAINQLSATANQVRENAQRAAEVSITADNEAAQGTRITTEVIQGIQQLMEEISRAASVIEQLASRSTEVGSVLDVIKSIAEQTNLLALNAAIEAARAGEMGRGFAVVADEVRNLANRSHQSTQEIESMIAQLQQGAQEAVTAMRTARQSAQQRSEQVQQAVSNLNTISGIVADIRQLNTQMDHAAQEQFAVTESISHNITHIAQLADNTAEDASRTSRVSEELARLSHQLNSLIEQFKLCK